MSRPTEVLLNLQALRHNTAHARTLAGPARVMAVVKANAYGHGATTIARALEPLVDAFAVACLEEALELRAAAIQRPILLLEGAFDKKELPDIARHSLWLTVANAEQLGWLEKDDTAQQIHCWLKVNTGMNRLGIAPADVRDSYLRLTQCSASAAPPVLCTHFASADNLRSAATTAQLGHFENLSDDVPTNTLRSAANSAALLTRPDSHYDWVRPGYMLYGNSPLSTTHDNTRPLQPVMTLRSTVIALRRVQPGDAVGYGGTFVATRPSLIASVAVGYGDGYPRQAPSGTPVLVNGERAKLAGRVSMDMLSVDVTDVAETAGVELGSPVTLWGPGLPVDLVAKHAGTLGYELTTRMPHRPPKIVDVP